MKTTGKILFNVILFLISLGLGFVSISAQDVLTGKMLYWDDDLKYIQDYKTQIAKEKEENKYIPYSGEAVIATFFDDSLANSYVYPEDKAKLAVKAGNEALKGSKYLDIQFPVNEYTGCGLLIANPVDLTNPILLQSMYLDFYINLKTRDLHNIKIALVNTQQPRYQSSLNLENYVKQTKEGWQEVKIPINDFPKIGSCWDMKEQKMLNGKVKFNEILEVKIFASDPKLKIVNFLLDKIKIRADKVNNATFAPIYRDSISDLAYTYTYPQETKLTETSTEKYSGTSSLMMDFNPKSYSGIGLGVKTMNISQNKENFILEFWIKGKNGNEILYIGFNDKGVDDKTKCRVVLPLVSYIIVSKEWQKVEIPLSAFPITGKMWNGQKEEDQPFHYDKIQEVFFGANANENTDCTVYVDDIRIRYR